MLAAMTTANHRHERIGEEIAHEINAMLAGELKDPRLEISVVVNEVRIAPASNAAPSKRSNTRRTTFATKSWSVSSFAAFPIFTSHSIIRRNTPNASTSSSKK